MLQAVGQTHVYYHRYGRLNESDMLERIGLESGASEVLREIVPADPNFRTSDPIAVGDRHLYWVERSRILRQLLPE